MPFALRHVETASANTNNNIQIRDEDKEDNNNNVKSLLASRQRLIYAILTTITL
jgi:hypothetical protein